MCVATKASAVIGVDNISNPSKTKDMTCSDCMSMMQKLLNKLTNASLKEKITILTLVRMVMVVQIHGQFSKQEFILIVLSI